LALFQISPAIRKYQISKLHQEINKEVTKTVSSQAILSKTISPEEVSHEKIPT
jgi:hypothetical protein